MTWRVFLTDSSQPDLDVLTPADRSPSPRNCAPGSQTDRLGRVAQIVAGVQLFEDQLPSGISVTYFVDEQVPYVGVVRIRRR
ncbi:MAG: hypothetical protein M3063_06720 [Actinomycetota bacterium]|nr:hypothetical protein [Actinomycetota bacterium]